MTLSFTYGLVSSQDLISVDSSSTYYLSIDPDNPDSWPGRSMDNALGEYPITDIWWNVTRGCLNVDGLIETAEPANLTIVGCVHANNLTIHNLAGLKFLGDKANITLDGVGTKANPIYTIAIDAPDGAVDFSGNNYLVELNVKTGTFNQTGSGLILSKFVIEAPLITFTNASKLEVGKYHLRGEVISYRGIIDAKTGDIIIDYLGDSFNITSPLLGRYITINGQGVVNNHDQIVGSKLIVNSLSFNNYGRVKINTEGQFFLIEDFYNAANGIIEINGELSIRSPEMDHKTHLIRSEGNIEIGTGWFQAKMLEIISTNFKKTDFIATRISHVPEQGCAGSYHTCYTYKENIISYPTLCILKSARDLHLHVDIFRVRSSKIYSDSHVYFYNSLIIYEDFNLRKYGTCSLTAIYKHFSTSFGTNILNDHGTVSYTYLGENCCECHGRWRSVGQWDSSANPVTYRLNSHIYAKDGIEGVVIDVDLSGEMLWLAEIQGGDSISHDKGLVIYDPNAGKALANLLTKKRVLQLKLLQAFMRSAGSVQLDIISLSEKLNPNRFVFDIKDKAAADTIDYVVIQNPNLLQYPVGTLAPAVYGEGGDYFEKHVVSFFAKESVLQNIKIRFLGDLHYLEHLFGERIFFAIGYITGLDNNRLAEILLENAFNPSDGEVYMASSRGDEFKIGKPLTQSQIDALSKPIAWFIEQDNCLNTGRAVMCQEFISQKNL